MKNRCTKCNGYGFTFNILLFWLPTKKCLHCKGSGYEPPPKDKPKPSPPPPKAPIERTLPSRNGNGQ